MTAPGPFNDEREVLALPEVRAILDHGHIRDGNLGILTGALARAGVDVGDYEGIVLRWLTGFEPQTVATIAGWIERAHEAGKAARP